MKTIDLTQGDERSQLIRITIPMIWAVLAVMATSLADTFFVGQLGTDELATMGFTIPVVMIIGSLAFGIGTGASSLIARAIGRQQHDLVQSYSTQSIIIAVLLAIVVASIGVLTIDDVFLLLGAPERLLPLIHEYMDIWYIGAVLVVVPMVGNSVIRAAGNTRLPSLLMISIAIINLILNPIFIFGWLGVPRMELAGAALASLVAYASAFLISFYILRVKLNFLSFDACFKKVWHYWKEIFTLSIPSAINNLIAPISVAITTWLVAQHGSDAVAGYSIASRIEMISLIVFVALSTTLPPFAGQNWGAGRFDRLKRILLLSFQFSWLWGAGIAIVLWLTAHWLVRGFTDEPTVIDAATSYLYLVPITFGLLGSMMAVSSVANGIGQPSISLWLTLIRMVFLYIPLAWGLSWWLGLTGIYLATMIANIVVGAVAIWWGLRQCSRKPKA